MADGKRRGAQVAYTPTPPSRRAWSAEFVTVRHCFHKLLFNINRQCVKVMKYFFQKIENYFPSHP